MADWARPLGACESRAVTRTIHKCGINSFASEAGSDPLEENFMKKADFVSRIPDTSTR